MSLSRFLVLFALISPLIACRAADALTLAKDGRANAMIVVPPGATAASRETAFILSDHLKQVSGATFEVIGAQELNARVVGQRIVTTPASPVDNFILLGDSQLARSLGATSSDLGPGGILIRTFPNALVLLGPSKATPTDQYGTRYAVTTFLEDALDCRFLWPGELGKVVPERHTIEIPQINHTFTPILKQRRFVWLVDMAPGRTQVSNGWALRKPTIIASTRPR